MTSAKVIADSLSAEGHRLTTMELVFPRIILSEFNTHRVFSRNSASSRAIPVERVIEQVQTNPYVPKVWTSNKPGMQGGEPLTGQRAADATAMWMLACTEAVESAACMLDSGVHKQHVNRLLEPFMWHQVVVSSTEWDNFFDLRLSPSAQPEMQDLAFEMFQALLTHAPVRFYDDYGRWHLPYIQDDERGLDPELMKKVSVARCARVSYMRQNEQREFLDDVRLYDRLLKDRHMSPFEHVARPIRYAYDTQGAKSNYGNFMGWEQLRHVVEFENRTKEDR